MVSVLIGIFSIPAAALLVFALSVGVLHTQAVIVLGYDIIAASLLALAANAYAISISKQFKKTQVATLAVAMPWISTALSVAGLVFGIYFVSLILKP